MATADLTALSRAGGVSVARPRRRVLTRVVVPAAIILGALGLLAYAARESLRSAVDVTVAPVVLVSGTGGAIGRVGEGGHQEVVQAPGWIEADPYDVGVPALATGVLKELLVLEGQRVVAGQVIAKLVDDDAKLALARRRRMSRRRMPRWSRRGGMSRRTRPARRRCTTTSTASRLWRRRGRFRRGRLRSCGCG